MRIDTLQAVEPLITNKVHVEMRQTQIGVALFGRVIEAYTKSPMLWNAVFAENNINARYQAFDIPTPDNVQKMLGILSQDKNYFGNNVGSPYKTPVFKMLSEIGEVDESAKHLESVNTVVNKEGKLYGYSTDGKGEIANLRTVMPDFHGKRVLMIGAGGAAPAVAAALLEEGIRDITLANRTPVNAENIAKSLGKFFPDQLKVITENEIVEHASTGNYDLIINASLKGQAEKPTAAYSALGIGDGTVNDNLAKSQKAIGELARANPNIVCADLIYNPAETPFLTHAREAGLKTNNGKLMLVHQAAIAFQLMFDNRPGIQSVPYDSIVKVMAQAYDKSFQK